MAVTLNFSVFWFIMRGADFVRPSALHRTYAYFWLFILSWAILVGVTVLEDRFQIASGYMFVFYEIAIFFALAISLVELFALPTKTQFAASVHSQDEAVDSTNAPPDSDALISPTEDEHPEPESGEAADEPEGPDPTESTPLIGGNGARGSRTTTFANYARRSLRRTHDGASDSIDGEVSSRLAHNGLGQSWNMLIHPRMNPTVTNKPGPASFLAGRGLFNSSLLGHSFSLSLGKSDSSLSLLRHRQAQTAQHSSPPTSCSHLSPSSFFSP